MVEIADIVDEVSLRKWLRHETPEMAVLLAHRATARVMPPCWAWAADSTTQSDLTDIALWRILITSRVRTVCVTREVGPAAGAAARAANAAADAAADAAARSTARAAFADDDAAGAFAAAAAFAATSAFAAAAADIWQEVRRDAAAYLETDMRAPIPLWSGGMAEMPPEIAEAWETTRAALAARIEAGETGWQFWIDWYEAQLTGADQNWEMLKEIVLIPDADWQKGAAHVNGLIEEIRLKHAIPASPNAEVLEVNPKTGLIRARPRSEIAANFLQDCQARIRDAMQIVGDPAQGNNPYGALAPEIAALDRALARYPDRPQRLHDVALQVVRRVTARERTGEIPEAEKDALVADFKSELIGVANDIRQQDAEVQKVVDARVTDKLRNADPADAAVLPEAAPVLADATETDLAEELVEDADLAADAEADPQTRKEALYRFASRTFRIVSLLYKVPRAVLREGAEVSTDIAAIVTNSAKVKIAIAILLAFFG